ncbi:substrate-binding domain-containing protein, partial [Clostridium saudiense]|nr:substrate-binding domain-containing protein [Clostridium saudiense]
DNIQATYEATKHLLDKGLKNIAFVGVKKDAANAWGYRFLGYEKALKEAGIEIDEDLVFLQNLKYRAGHDAAEKFLKLEKKIEGVVCASDEIAMGVINGLREKGINTPNDVSVIGFNNNAIA